MRYCSNCKRINTDHPPFCRYCGRSWYVRLCPRGHPNPRDANFCGDCGNTDLTETTGSIPFWLRAVAWIGVGLILFTAAPTIFELASTALVQFFCAVISLIFIGLFVMAFLPQASTNAISDVLLWC